jgi:hypothetical protein
VKKKPPAWEPPRFTVLDLDLDPEQPSDCIHGLPAHLATTDGWPRCAECRHRLKAIRGELRPRTPAVTPTTAQGALDLSPTDRAAGAHLEEDRW